MAGPIVGRINQALDQISADPFTFPQSIELSGSDQRRWRVGAWRILYQVNEAQQTVIVTQIVHRREAYR